jgi:lipopolysaccharide/colanic/teichoic acid biosynthesis glycosyltransferase
MILPGFPRLKRAFDLALTLPGLLLTSPILAVIALLVWIYHGRPVIFRQKRPGYQGQPFYLFKFRTMTDARDLRGSPLPDEQRLTPLGRFLRSTSLDELPELFNVVRGEMSLVGPRPLLIQYLERYSPEQMRRHNTPPGITGWAQINGRNALTWEDKFRLDVWYVDNWSIGLDLKILLLTLWKVLKREGISQPGFVSAEEFMGNGESRVESRSREWVLQLHFLLSNLGKNMMNNRSLYRSIYQIRRFEETVMENFLAGFLGTTYTYLG